MFSVCREIVALFFLFFFVREVLEFCLNVMHLSHHASISYTLHTLCGHASILRASIFCAHFFPFSANTSTASSGKHCRVLARTHMLAACAQYLLHARYTLTASFLQGLHHYYTLHRLSVQIEVPSRGSISKKKLFAYINLV